MMNLNMMRMQFCSVGVSSKISLFYYSTFSAAFPKFACILLSDDSDLHMLINKENFFSATLISHSGFGFVWAGARATFGFEKGKVYYEARVSNSIIIPLNEKIQFIIEIFFK